MTTTTRLGDLVSILGGGTPSRSHADYYNGDIPWVTVKDLKDELTLRSSQERITKLGLENSASRLVPAGNVIVATRMAVGKAVRTLVDVAINQDLKAVVCGERIDSRFLLFFLHSKASLLEAKASGSTVKGILIEDLQELEVNLPPLPEQQRIVSQLEQADRLVRTRRYAIELTESLLPAAFLELFGDTADRFPAFTVDELAADKPHAIRTGPFGSQLLHSEFTDRGIAVLGIDNAVNNEFTWNEGRFITPKKYEQLKRYTVFPGDVIITIMGTCGRCAIVPDYIPTAINTKHLCCITLDHIRCLSIYLHGAFLFHPFVRRQQEVATKGAIMDGLNMDIIKNLRIPLPPLPLQRNFAALVERVERLRAVQREALRQAEHLFTSLLHRAFSC